MNSFYWIAEYGKVMAAYIFLMYIWPSVVFHDYLKKKSRGIRFCFCITFQVILINTVVLGLGLLHILHGWILAVLFYGTFILAVIRQINFGIGGTEIFRKLLMGTCGIRLFCSNMRVKFTKWCKNKLEQMNQNTAGRKMEFLLLQVIVIFGMLYFGYGTYYDKAYGCGDLYVHHSWIYGLMQGKPFSAGVYPEAMHCFVYCIHVLFGVKIYSILLLLAGIHIPVFLICAYLFFRELFVWRGTAVLTLAAFLTVNLLTPDAVESMSRLQWTIPQEFGLYTEFLCALFLLRCLKEDFSDIPKGIRNKWKWFMGKDNLILFSFALAASFAIHFYVTIMAFFLCVVVALGYFFSIFRKKRLLPLVTAVTFGMLIAIAPMGAALAAGIPFQGSIGWALDVIKGGSGQSEEEQNQMSPQGAADRQGDTGKVIGIGENLIAAPGTLADSGVRVKMGTADKTVSKRITLFSSIKKRVLRIYRYGYKRLFLAKRAEWILALSAAGICIWMLFRLIAGITALVWRGRGRETVFIHWLDGYPLLVLMSMVFLLCYGAKYIGLPPLVDGVRLCSTTHMLALAVVLIPVDLILGLLSKTGINKILPIVMLLGTGGIYMGTQQLDIYHSYLFNWSTGYNSCVNVTNKIMNEFPDNAYTVVSTTNELYQVIECGRHEEIFNFIQRINGDNYTLPTEYIFVYVEKKPFSFAQIHFPKGPDWLARGSYGKEMGHEYSEGKNYLAGSIAGKNPDQMKMPFGRLSDIYEELESRTVVEARAHAWYEKFSKLYPRDTKVFYEDDDFCCYMVRQNPYRLYQLEVK